MLSLEGLLERGRDVLGDCNTGVPPVLGGVRGGREEGLLSRLAALFKWFCMI